MRINKLHMTRKRKARSGTARSKGFSLVEVALAMGIIGFAIVGVIGLFPTALKTAQKSQRETRATHIARKVYESMELHSGTLFFPDAIAPSIMRTNILNTPGTYYLGFSQDGRAVTNTISASDWNSGVKSDALFLARLLISSPATNSSLRRTTLTISVPAQAPATNRSEYTFASSFNGQ